MPQHVVVVGAGQAASQAIQSLRQQGFTGAVTLVGEEPYVPYQRPPLSKKYLAGELPRERLFLRPESFYAEKGVTLALGRRATKIDRAARTLVLDDATRLEYDRLLLATGSRVRRLDVPGAALEGVHYLRTVADVDSISAALRPGARVVMIGAGYIGLEVAAVIVKRGVAVTVLEAAPRVMSRVVSAEVAAFFDACHRENGVELHLGAVVRALHGASRVTGVETADGRTFPCDLVIAGIGVVPNVELALAAGLPCDNGIVVDEYARTEDERIVAAGDCTSQPLPMLGGRRVRLESVANAVHQGKVAAATLAGAPAAYSEVPWFWSDQYDLKLQIAGLAFDAVEVVFRGDPTKRSFTAFRLADGRIAAVEAVNSPRDFMHGKRLVGARIPAERLRDPAFDLAAAAP